MHNADRYTVRWLRATVAVFLKDWHSELRTRYAISALGMFVVTTISMILFSLAGEQASPEVLAGMLWVVIFFAAMSGLAADLRDGRGAGDGDDAAAAGAGECGLLRETALQPCCSVRD